MSYPYTHDHPGRPQPHVTIPVAPPAPSPRRNTRDRPLPPVPPRPTGEFNSDSGWNADQEPVGGFAYPHPHFQQPQQPSWEQYAEAANAQYNPEVDYYEGHGHGYEHGGSYGNTGYDYNDRYGYEHGREREHQHGYDGYGYENGGELTPNARHAHRNGNGYDYGNEGANYFSNPFSPSASPTAPTPAVASTSYYHMHEGVDVQPQPRQSSIATAAELQRPASYTEGCTPITDSTYNPEAGSFAFPEPELHRNLSQRAQAPSMRRQSISDLGPAPSLHRNVSYASSYAPSFTSMVSFGILLCC